MAHDGEAARDIATLRSLNDDYIRSVQNGDVRRFDEILAEEFYCSKPTARWSTAAVFSNRRRGRWRFRVSPRAM